MLQKTLTLSNSVKIPVIGFGTYQMPPQTCSVAVSAALSQGYRHIDTAIFYRTHKVLGSCIESYPRSSLFISSKVPPNLQGYDAAKRAVLDSLKDLNTPYLDLMLVHWPGVQGLGTSDLKQVEMRHGTWAALEELYVEGKIKAIGTSNFLILHLEKLLKVASVKPTVNQVEFHPWGFDQKLHEFCHKEKIIIEAYSPLGRAQNDLWSNPELQRLADKHDATKAQILLRWNTQKGNVVLPKSITPERIKSNTELNFELSTEDMDVLDNFNVGKKTCWDPSTILV